MENRWNEYFAENMNGKEVEFDVQPYARGRMMLNKVSERRIKHMESCPRRGRMLVEYVTYDIEGVVSEGSERSRLFQHVSYRDLVGKPYSVSGVSYEQLLKAVVDGERIIIARCG